jgi:hypothetical protein
MYRNTCLARSERACLFKKSREENVRRNVEINQKKEYAQTEAREGHFGLESAPFEGRKGKLVLRRCGCAAGMAGVAQGIGTRMGGRPPRDDSMAQCI